jgi:hypothetical protein
MLIKQAWPLLWKNISWLMALKETTRSRVVTSFAVRPLNNRHGIYLERESNPPLYQSLCRRADRPSMENRSLGQRPRGFSLCISLYWLDLILPRN